MITTSIFNEFSVIQFLKQEIGITYINRTDLCFDHNKELVRWLTIYTKPNNIPISFDDLIKIKEFLQAKNLMIYTHSSDERGWEPLTILILYKNEQIEDFKDYFPK